MVDINLNNFDIYKCAKCGLPKDKIELIIWEKENVQVYTKCCEKEIEEIDTEI